MTTALDRFRGLVLYAPIGTMVIPITNSLARYTLLGEIGRGGMGVVREARDPLGFGVAIKMLHEELERDPESVRDFQREAQALAKIDHPNVAKVFDFGLHPRPFMVMERIDGLTLAGMIRGGGALGTERSVRIAHGVACGLRAAHAQGIVHRDVKPSNIRCQRSHDGQPEIVKLTDFGIARERGQPLTLVRGTPQYMSPEQCDASGRANVDVASDVYSLGTVLYEMLIGQALFQSEDLAALEEERPMVRSRLRALEGEPKPLRKLVAEMLSRLPRKRPSMHAVIDHLDQIARELQEARFSHTYRRAANRATHRTLVVVGTVALVAASIFVFRRHASSVRRLDELHQGAIRGLTPLRSLGGGPSVKLGFPAHVRQSLLRPGRPDWLRAKLERMVERIVDIAPFQLEETEVNWTQLAAWLNELLARKLIHVDTEGDGPIDRYVLNARGELILDLFSDWMGITYDRSDGFRVRQGFELKPVELISHDGAASYCAFYGRRLPTSAEFEFAVRGFTSRLYPWGKDENDLPPTCEQGAFERDPKSSGGMHACVGRSPEGPDNVRWSSSDEINGIRNLFGNVSEWVSDRFMDPSEPETLHADYREYKGASYLSPYEFGFSGYRSRLPRYGKPVDIARRGLGFRCASD